MYGYVLFPIPRLAVIPLAPLHLTFGPHCASLYANFLIKV